MPIGRENVNCPELTYVSVWSPTLLDLAGPQNADVLHEFVVWLENTALVFATLSRKVWSAAHGAGSYTRRNHGICTPTKRRNDDQRSCGL